MHSEILPVSLKDKQEEIDYIRTVLIPSLVAKGHCAEKELKILHLVGTWHAKPVDIEHEYRNLSYTAFYAGIEPVPHHKDLLEKKIIDDLGGKPERFVPYSTPPKGRYRIIGIFAPNPYIGWYIPDAQQYFTGAMPVSTRDYQFPESPLYHPPVINIDKYMSQIGKRFNADIAEANDPEAIANAVARFYFCGVALIHPFIGGNHRGFDRFLELSFAQKGITFKTPQNETLNIPNDNPFNTEIYKERRRIILEFGLDEEKPIGQGKKEQPRWLRYQGLLNQTLSNVLTSDFIQTKTIAQALLNWL